MFGIIEKGEFRQPPRKLLNVPRSFTDADGNTVTGFYNVGYDPAKEPDQEVVDYLLASGYLPVTEAERPEDGDGYYFVDRYEPDGDHITQVWERREVAPPDPDPEITAERALNIILTGRDSYEAE